MFTSKWNVSALLMMKWPSATIFEHFNAHMIHSPPITHNMGMVDPTNIIYSNINYSV